MLRHAKGWLRTAVALATFAGLRIGKVRALEVRDVDWTYSRLFVPRALSDGEVVTPKSGHERVVPLAPDLALILAEAVEGKSAATMGWVEGGGEG
jgi:integrase